MTVLLTDGLMLVDVQPACIKARYTNAQEGAFTFAADARGEATLFERFQSPACFIEVIKTNPGAIRGNHVHQDCDETLHVISGEIELFLLCEHGKHVFMRVMQKGDVVVTARSTPHALYSVQASECIVLFDTDPREDRVRVPILKF